MGLILCRAIYIHIQGGQIALTGVKNGLDVASPGTTLVKVSLSLKTNKITCFLY